MYNWYTFVNDSSMTLVFEDEYYIDYVVFTTINVSEKELANVKLLNRDQMVIWNFQSFEKTSSQGIKMLIYNFKRMPAKYLLISPKPDNKCLYSVLVNYEVLHKPCKFFYLILVINKKLNKMLNMK